MSKKYKKKRGGKLLTKSAHIFLYVLVSRNNNMSNLTYALAVSVIGMIAAIVILILISILMTLLRYATSSEKPKTQTLVPTQPEIAEQPENVLEKEEVDDLELIAVITAAIASSLNTTPDKLIVRSIKTSNRWAEVSKLQQQKF